MFPGDAECDIQTDRRNDKMYVMNKQCAFVFVFLLFHRAF
jgi:hypothetical protein